MTCIIVDGEVDVALATDTEVLTIDSDFWIHYEKFPILERQLDVLSVIVFEQESILAKVDLSISAFRVLAIVSGSDYARNVETYGCHNKLQHYPVSFIILFYQYIDGVLIPLRLISEIESTPRLR